MIYVMSDIHGCYDKYIEMLNKINLQSHDILYILGDVVDRGPDGIKTLLDMQSKGNIIFIRGNHDQTAMSILECLYNPTASFDEDRLVTMIQMWSSDGGKTTLEEFMKASESDKKNALTYIKKSKIYKEITVNDNNYLLAHSVPSKDLMMSAEKQDLNGFLWGKPDYDLKYYDDKILVTGHTPTGLIDKDYTGKIYIKNNHIAIDCGAVFSEGRLGCLCLETMEEIYSS